MGSIGDLEVWMSDGVGTSSGGRTAPPIPAPGTPPGMPPATPPRSSAEPAPDVRVMAAFSLGWHVAELYRPDMQRMTPAHPDDLPALGRLDSEERLAISLCQVDAGLARLGPGIAAVNLSIPGTAQLHAAFRTPPNLAARSRAVSTLHVALLSRLTATDVRLGKAYELGRALADTCRHQFSVAGLAREFGAQRIARLRSWLDDLASVLPAHAAKSVNRSLGRWSAAVQAPAAPTGPGTHPAAAPAVPPAELLDYLSRQGELWRALLSGEKAGADMLVVANYLDAAAGMLATSRAIVMRFLRHFWWLAIVIVLLFIAGALAIILAAGSAASIAAGALSVLTSVGLTWKGVGSALGRAARPIEDHVWGAELDQAIADAITLLPANDNEKGGRRKLAEDASRGATRAVGPAPQLLDPVIDPDRLQEKIGELKAARHRHRDDLAQLGPGQRLPAGWFDDLDAQIEGEKQEPGRVTRASDASHDSTGSEPPRVIYLSRRPEVSQFMSVITTCIETEISSTASDIGPLDRAWREVRHWSDDLRSRFQRFGPCDIRWIEPRLAQLASDLRGRHDFATNPPEVRIADTATVIVLGNWATGLPQALNTAARIREHLGRIPAGTDCHVIHLGDTYYSGLEEECRRRFLDQWPVARDSTVAGSWTLSGSHDVHAGAHGYFDVLLTDPRFAAQAGCSYFALVNDHWQLLGLDSAYADPEAAELHPPQADWLSARMVAASGARGTILMTHHQPFSAFEPVRTPLAQTVAAAVGPHRVDAWLWAYENRCAVYDSGVVTRQYGDAAGYAAIVGHGGVPQLAPAETPPNVNEAIAWQLRDQYQVEEDRWALGGYAVLSFDGPRLAIQYYDEYGQAARTGTPLVYRPPIDVTTLAPHDSRTVRDPDVITPAHLR
ncbi:MAG: metallophosphoesterase family protein [Solirubrobacteraceae bacterium]